MRRAVTAVATACLFAGPTVLAFFSGGYGTEPRLVAAIVAWTLVLALAVTGLVPLPRSRPGQLAFGGLVVIAAWSALSIARAPLNGPAVESVQRLVLYIGALMLAIGVLRSPRALRAAEPALAAGAIVVIGYGLAGRLLPGLLELARSQSAGGRLEQPITYWNGTGALAAMALVLSARLAGDGSRPVAVRALAAAAAAPLGAGLALSYSRGSLAVAALGLVVLVAAAPSRSQLRAVALTVATALAATAVAMAFPGVASLDGTASDRARDGAVVLAVMALVAAVAALLTAGWARAEPPPGASPPAPRWTRRLGAVTAVAVVAGAVGLVAGGLAERPTAAELGRGAAPSRLTTVSSNRYEYWRVGRDAFKDRPITGVGPGGFRVVWLRERSILEAVKDVHSLEIEMAAELGLIGLAAFAAMVGGVAWAGRRALRRDPALAAGACAATLVWLLHASIDWDWQLPAVTLPAIVLAGALIAMAEAAPEAL